MKHKQIEQKQIKQEQMKHRVMKQRGFSLLEVLIGIAIFAIGMLALASLQGNLTRSANDANVRTVATNLAEALIENRRGFARLADATDTWPAFDDIVNETRTLIRGGVVFTISSVVGNYYYQLTSDSFVYVAAGVDAPEGKIIPDYKLMTVTVSWLTPDFRSQEGTADLTSADLGTGSITISDSISSMTTLSSSRAITQEESVIEAPAVDYNPGSRPDIVSISLGDNKFKESLLPEPDVIRLDELVETRFDVITYSQTDSGSLFLRREEFIAISCECTLKAPPGTAESAGRRPTIWAGDEYTETQFVDKPYGESANNRQSEFCDICCRDHHDGGSSGDDHADTAVNQYYPFRDTGDYFDSDSFDGDHKHYDRVGHGNTPPTLELADAVDDTYVEACKLVRKDGFFKVAQDFRQEDSNAFPENFLVEDAEIDTYSTYVTTAVDEYEDATYADYEPSPPCIGGPSPCLVEPTYGGAWPTELQDDEFPSWTQLPMDGAETQQLRSRGVYIDYLSYDIRTVIDCLRDGGTVDSCQTGDVILDQTESTNILEIIPFFDVQLSFLNRWTESPTNTPVDATNEGLEDDNAHTRGMISRDALGGSSVDASGHMSNLGFTDTQAIDNNYTGDITTATIIVQSLNDGGGDGGIPNPGNDPVVSGTISETLPRVRGTDIEVEGQNGVLCDRTVSGYECVIPPSASSNGRVKFFGYGKVNLDAFLCLTGNTLVLESEVTNGSNAHAIYQVFGSPQPDGSGFDIHVQDTACSGGFGG